MWAERPQAPPSEPARDPSAAVKTATDTLASGITRDGALLRDSLKKAGLPVQGGLVSPGPLIAEAQDGYWDQRWSDGGWGAGGDVRRVHDGRPVDTASPLRSRRDRVTAVTSSTAVRR